jgi:hypothetical protein
MAKGDPYDERSHALGKQLRAFGEPPLRCDVGLLFPSIGVQNP